jgi:hypothetical protein
MQSVARRASSALPVNFWLSLCGLPIPNQDFLVTFAKRNSRAFTSVATLPMS